MPQATKPAISDPEPLAPMYGRADHVKRQDAMLSPGARLQLVLRALYLLLVFAPFLLLGVPLLLIAACIPARAPPELVCLHPMSRGTCAHTQTNNDTSNFTRCASAGIF